MIIINKWKKLRQKFVKTQGKSKQQQPKQKKQKSEETMIICETKKRIKIFVDLNLHAIIRWSQFMMFVVLLCVAVDFAI